MVDFQEGVDRCLEEGDFVYPGFMDQDKHLAITMILLVIKSQFVQQIPKLGEFFDNCNQYVYFLAKDLKRLVMSLNRYDPASEAAAQV